MAVPENPSVNNKLFITRLTRRFWSKVRKTRGCWHWTGLKDPVGYGKFTVKWSTFRAHRIAYILLKANIHNGKVLHHKCENPGCVNPAHLKPLTTWEHLMIGDTFQRRNVEKTHCVHGHVLAGNNLRKTKDGYRHCRECSILWKEARRRDNGPGPRGFRGRYKTKNSP